jgi:hypothetical protein
MYLSRVAAYDAGMSWRSKPGVRRASAIPPTSDVAAFLPRYAQHSGATLPDPQWAFGNSTCFDLSIPAFMSTCENPVVTRFTHLAWGAH